MNQCYGCSTCKSADKPLEGYIASLPMETSHHRVESQSTKCGFGLQGVCCRLCSNGPCRITPKAPRGICGATADVIVTRNFLRAVAAGSGCYIHIVENTALNVLKTAQAKGEIKGEKALEHLAEKLGVTGKDKYEKAEKVAKAVGGKVGLRSAFPEMAGVGNSPRRSKGRGLPWRCEMFHESEF